MNVRLLIALNLLVLLFFAGCVIDRPACEIHKVCYQYGNGFTNDRQISCYKEWDYYRYESIRNDSCSDNSNFTRYYDDNRGGE